MDERIDENLRNIDTYNGGMGTLLELEELLKNDKNKIHDVVIFISNLKIYHKYEERVVHKDYFTIVGHTPVNNIMKTKIT